MAALCQNLVRLREASKAELIVVHHVRKSIGRQEIGCAFHVSSSLHAVGDSYLLLMRPSAQLPAWSGVSTFAMPRRRAPVAMLPRRKSQMLTLP
jgi:hypothetical protein